jgi:hypothetical protein
LWEVQRGREGRKEGKKEIKKARKKEGRTKDE